MGLFSRLGRGLKKTRGSFARGVDSLLRGRSRIDEDLLEELEELMLSADMGVDTAEELIEHVRAESKSGSLKEPEQVRQALKERVCSLLSEHDDNGAATAATNRVTFFVGVNGVGKTTTIGKLAHSFTNEGRRVLIAAADTFRAAASEQLEVWAERSGVEILTRPDGSDPSSVIFDALQAARARSVDEVLVDTAGRLHTRHNLMNELEKMSRVAGREVKGAPHEVLLVLDATTGQNGLSQAREFKKIAGITGLVLTKLDGTARGGVAVAIVREFGTPIRYVGVGEGKDDLIPFDPEAFADALFSPEASVNDPEEEMLP